MYTCMLMRNMSVKVGDSLRKVFFFFFRGINEIELSIFQEKQMLWKTMIFMDCF